MSLFVSFEGGEGSGKSTQASKLQERLQHAQVPSVLIHEPGTTPLGLYVREWVKRGKRREATISHGAELFLFAAARAELVTKVVRPALSRLNTVVIADRYADSTVAYQGYGRRLPLADVAVVNRLAVAGVMPDLTFLLDCPPVNALMRVGSQQIRLPLGPLDAARPARVDEEGGRRFEEEPLDFHERVRSGYLKMAKKESARWRVIDATKTVDEVGDLVWAQVEHRLQEDAHADAGEANSLLRLWDGDAETS